MRKLGIVLAGMVLVSGHVMAKDPAMRIVDEGSLGKTYDIAPDASLAAPGYPEMYADTGDDVCIALGYTVMPDGSTGDFRLLSAWSSDRGAAQQQPRYLESFAGAAANAVSQWRFVPKSTEAQGAVQTVTTMAFNGKGVTEGLADRCRISNLAVHYNQRKTDRDFRQSMVAQGHDNAILANMRGQAASAISMRDRQSR